MTQIHVSAANQFWCAVTRLCWPIRAERIVFCVSISGFSAGSNDTGGASASHPASSFFSIQIINLLISMKKSAITLAFVALATLFSARIREVTPHLERRSHHAQLEHAGKLGGNNATPSRRTRARLHHLSAGRGAAMSIIATSPTWSWNEIVLSGGGYRILSAAPGKEHPKQLVYHDQSCSAHEQHHRRAACPGRPKSQFYRVNPTRICISLGR